MSGSPLDAHVASPEELRDRIAAERRGAPFLVYRTDAGEQVNSCRRLAELPGPVGLNGPTIVICEMPGTRVSAWKTLSAPTTRVRTIIAAAMVCGPAVARIRVAPLGCSVTRSSSRLT